MIGMFDGGSPNVSVLIPSYNMACYLSEAIISVLEGEFNSFEIIVVDDGSTDHTRSVMEEFTEHGCAFYDPRIQYLYQENAGKSAALNRALKYSKGDYIAILDADDRIPPRGLLERYKPVQLSRGSVPEIVIGQFEVFSQKQTFGKRRLPQASDVNDLYKHFYFHWKTPFHLNSCLFSRDLFCRTGLFDTRLRRCQDIDYSLRLLKASKKITRVPKTVYQYRKHRASFIERTKLRKKTLLHRPLVYWKNYEGFRRYLAVTMGVLLDAGKMLYELGGNYKS